MVSKTPPLEAPFLGTPVSDPPPRLPRCRMLDGRLNRCSGEALSTDPKVIRICARHAGEVLELVAEQQSLVLAAQRLVAASARRSA